MRRHIRRAQLPVGLAAAVAAAVPAGAGAAPPHAPSGADPDTAAPAATAMRWATGAVQRPREFAAHRRIAVRQARGVGLRRRAFSAVRAVRSRVGDAYAYGASGPGAFDCSGLTAWAMARAGIALPHSSFAQAETGTPVDRSDIRAGDLVFFSTAGPGASHVGIATGPDTVVSATSHGVMAHSISDAYWGSAYEGARRVVTRRVTAD